MIVTEDCNRWVGGKMAEGQGVIGCEDKSGGWSMQDTKVSTVPVMKDKF